MVNSPSAHHRSPEVSPAVIHYYIPALPPRLPLPPVASAMHPGPWTTTPPAPAQIGPHDWLHLTPAGAPSGLSSPRRQSSPAGEEGLDGLKPRRHWLRLPHFHHCYSSTPWCPCSAAASKHPQPSQNPCAPQCPGVSQCLRSPPLCPSSLEEEVLARPTLHRGQEQHPHPVQSCTVAHWRCLRHDPCLNCHPGCTLRCILPQGCLGDLP